MTRAHLYLACALVIVANLVLLHYAHSLEQPPMSPSQDARARQMTEAVEAAAKIPQPKQDRVWISQRVCVSPWLLEKRK